MGRTTVDDVSVLNVGGTGEGEAHVLPLERADIIPVRLDNVHLPGPEERIGHLGSVERRVCLAVAKPLPVGTDGPVAEEHVGVQRPEHVVCRSLLGPGLSCATILQRRT